MQEDIATTIRKGWSPRLTEAMRLPEHARRLDRALKVAEKWLEVAREGSPEMWAQAQYTRDKLEEELSRVCFEMRVEESRRDYGEEHEGQARSDELSNTLLEAYCALSRAPSELLGDGSPRARYAVMGALMVEIGSLATNAEPEAKPAEATA